MINFRNEKSIEDIEKLAKKRAFAIRSGKAESVDEYIMLLKRWWCNKYNRPLRDPLLEDYSLYDLLFEFYLFSDNFDDQDDVVGEIVKDNLDEASSIFDDFFEEDTKPRSPAPKADLTKEEEDFMNKAFPQDEWSMSEDDFR